jgi:hypothetical protein
MSTQAIYNYRKVDEQLITGGQPTEEDLKSAADEFRSSIWQGSDEPVWEAFIDRVKAQIADSSRSDVS